VKLVFGSDVIWADRDRSRADLVLDQIATWKSARVPPRELLRAMTTHAAALLGIDKDRGAISPGLYADLVAMPANPLSDPEALRDICFVMKDGKVVRSCDGSSRTDP
jgi:imidazolonepropionase-like amidohydrolase